MLHKIIIPLSLAFIPAVFDDFVIGIGFLGSLGVMLYMYVTGTAVPSELYALNGIFVGYYIRNMVAATKTTSQQSIYETPVIAPPSE
jgi:hypothetical protein